MDLSPHKIKFILPVLPTPTHLVQPSMPKATTGKTLDIFSTVIISLSLFLSLSPHLYEMRQQIHIPPRRDRFRSRVAILMYPRAYATNLIRR